MAPPLTVVEAAEALNVSVHTVRAWLRERRIGYTRLGRAVRIPVEEIEAFLERSWVAPMRPLNTRDRDRLAEVVLTHAPQVPRTSDLDRRSVDDLEVSVRTYHSLQQAKIQTLGDLTRHTEAELRKKAFGAKSIREIKEILQGLGLALTRKVN